MRALNSRPARFSLLQPALRSALAAAAEHRAGVISVSDEGLACTKAICNYIFGTYGRFPAGTDAIHLMWFVQAHHIDTDYYDRFFNPGAYGPTHASHMLTWHRERHGDDHK
jgi:hypothetical protein